LGSNEAAFEFHQRQWATIPAYFSEGLTHRTYPQETVLPFLRPVETLGEGAFGAVSVLTLPGAQHSFSSIGRQGVWPP
jgi:hypothetical protein